MTEQKDVNLDLLKQVTMALEHLSAYRTALELRIDLIDAKEKNATLCKRLNEMQTMLNDAQRIRSESVHNHNTVIAKMEAVSLEKDALIATLQRQLAEASKHE